MKFIFATTEVHKVPVTILSRVPALRLQAHRDAGHCALGFEQVLAQGESSRADAAAVQVLAREAAGSMRDAMSLLDQVIAFSGEGSTATT